VTQSANSKRVSNIKRTKILIIGPSGSGKTKLFYKLVAGDHETLTVSSTETNISNSIKIPAKISGKEIETKKSITLIDVPGHFNFRQKLRD